MSIIEMPRWANRKKREREEAERLYNEQYERNAYKLPEDMYAELDGALEEQDRRPLGTPVMRPRTARIISDEIEHLRSELTGARELVRQGEAKEAALVAELTKTVDEEIAAKKATHDADVAELESMRPATGETE